MPPPYREHDRVVVGAGMFGLFAAQRLLARGLDVAVVDLDRAPLLRASLVNQARVHGGYHYPRSVYTALRSAQYYDRFLRDFPSAVNGSFTKLYAIARSGSATPPDRFEAFCRTVGIRARPVDPGERLRRESVAAAYETDELAFDAPELRRLLLERMASAPGRLSWHLGREVRGAAADGGSWLLELSGGERLRTGGVVNATYAGSNAVAATFGMPGLQLGYELCEVVLVEAPAHRGLGITVMDGPFFSLMPFGHTGLHSFTAVDYTPRERAPERLPRFRCQAGSATCRPDALDNCGLCPLRPATTYPRMRALASGFLPDVGSLRPVESLHSVKVVLAAAEVDDARPTVARVDSTAPLFLTVFGGKINTVYDLEEVL